jgi:hypothetical protein
MSWVLGIAGTWFVVATLLALFIGRTIRVAQRRDRNRPKLPL